MRTALWITAAAAVVGLFAIARGGGAEPLGVRGTSAYQDRGETARTLETATGARLDGDDGSQSAVWASTVCAATQRVADAETELTAEAARRATEGAALHEQRAAYSAYVRDLVAAIRVYDAELAVATVSRDAAGYHDALRADVAALAANLAPALERFEQAQTELQLQAATIELGGALTARPESDVPAMPAELRSLLDGGVECGSEANGFFLLQR